MNKKLVALAVAGVFALPMAAQAQTANVTLYGRLNTDMELVKGSQAPIAGTNSNNTGGNPTVFRVSTNSSRFGIRGTESLGGGLSAIFQIESGIPADGGNQGSFQGATFTPAGLATRETFVGLQGAWGTFKMGRFLSPYDDIHPIFGNVPTLTTSILSTAALWGQGAYNADTGGFDDRLRNSIRYDSPVWSGFNFSVQASTWENLPTPSTHAGILSLGGYYTNGPWQAGLAYEKHKETRAKGVDDWAFTAALSYNFGIVRVGGVYQRLDYETCASTSTSNGICQTATLGHLKTDLWGLGLTIPAGPGTVYASYQWMGDGKGSAPNCPPPLYVNGVYTVPNCYNLGAQVAQVRKGDNTTSQHMTLSYTYPLSKRTLTYAGVTYINNQSNAVQTFNINPYGVAPGGDPLGFLAGMVHFF
jgi:predicted porin